MNKLAARKGVVAAPVDVKRHHHRDSIKKASYYVWFLGAKECRGLSGDEYVHPAVRHLVEKENNVEPLKVTLQVSSKGMKIVHNSHQVGVKNGASTKSGSKDEQPMKHFVPDNNICYVTQEASPNDDIVACIVLIPVTRYPLHVHVYRCDSVGTATLLRHHLQALVDRPENQKKLAELEQQQRRIQQQQQQQQQQTKRPASSPSSEKNFQPPLGVQTRPTTTMSTTSTDERNSESSCGDGGGSSSSDRENFILDERMSGLYVSLTAELREKLENRKNDGPILFPPKDYDMTLRRLREAHKHRPSILTASSPTSHINGRRSTERDSSGKSSGIGSDEAPSSPTHERGHPNLASSPVAAPSRQRHDSSSDNNNDDDDEQWNTDEERLIAAVKKPAFTAAAPPRDVLKRSPSPQPLVVNMDPTPKRGENTRGETNIWPPARANQRRGRVPLSPSRSFDEQSPPQRYDDSRVRRNESAGAMDSRYQELPDEKRYPGLDRETAARLPFNGAPDGGVKKVVTPTSPVREYDWDRQLRYYVPSERSPTDEYAQQQRYQQPQQQHPSMKRAPRLQPTGGGGDDDRRFYRYSSPDMEPISNPNYRY